MEGGMFDAAGTEENRLACSTSPNGPKDCLLGIVGDCLAWEDAAVPLGHAGITAFTVGPQLRDRTGFILSHQATTDTWLSSC